MKYIGNLFVRMFVNSLFRYFSTIVSLFGAGAGAFSEVFTAPAPAPAPRKPFRRLRLRLRLRPKCVGSGGSGSGSGSASLDKTGRGTASLSWCLKCAVYRDSTSDITLEWQLTGHFTWVALKGSGGDGGGGGECGGKRRKGQQAIQSACQGTHHLSPFNPVYVWSACRTSTAPNLFSISCRKLLPIFVPHIHIWTIWTSRTGIWRFWNDIGIQWRFLEKTTTQWQNIVKNQKTIIRKQKHIRKGDEYCIFSEEIWKERSMDEFIWLNFFPILFIRWILLLSIRSHNATDLSNSVDRSSACSEVVKLGGSVQHSAISGCISGPLPPVTGHPEHEQISTGAAARTHITEVVWFLDRWLRIILFRW